MNVPDKEREVLAQWRNHRCFETLLEASSTQPPYVFYDGPPFATGKPHYGHILAGTLKDVCTRYQTMKGKYVPRRFGWDCHGLPVEHLVDSQQDPHEKKTQPMSDYHAACRKVVMQCEQDWEYTVERMGRWIDFQHSYKTMDLDYMNGLWNLFAQLYQKGLIYQGWKVMPFSTALATPLSNFEANLNYKLVSHTDAYVCFPLADDPQTAFLAWTTTPWTLVSHVALCLHPTETYTVYRDTNSSRKYIVSSRFIPPASWVPETHAPGDTWKGTSYLPPFSFFPRAYTVVCDACVKHDVGTGVIHLAPAFGEDDFRICQGQEIPMDSFPCPLTPGGVFTEEVGSYAGMGVWDANKPILQEVKRMGRLWKQGTIAHSYPHCWRTDQPLIYRMVRSWFLRVETLKETCLAENKKVHWIPETIGTHRFHHWLEQAKDWALSRTRIWGTPIPVWVSEDGKETVVLSSKEELEGYLGTTLSDLHRETVDGLEIPSREGRGMLRRIPEVFDCWYESGAVPILMGQGPADFVAEGLDQTRGWFYTMLVLYVALYGKAPYKNVLCTGLVLAADGKKMSKRLHNYPDPLDIMERYGADALRMYLLDSPVVKGETLRFKEEGVHAMCKDVLLPWMNAVSFWKRYAVLEEEDRSASPPFPMDQWMVSYIHTFVEETEKDLASYQLWNVVGRLRTCVDVLTNVYVRMNRYRWKEGKSSSREASRTLFYVLDLMAKTMAPVAPLVCEWMYQMLHGRENKAFISVHAQAFPCPPPDSWYPEPAIKQVAFSAMETVRRVVELSRKIRVQQKIPLKQPLSEMILVCSQEEEVVFLHALKEVLQREVNVGDIRLDTHLERYAHGTLVPHLRAIGKKYGRQSNIVLQHLAQGILHEGLVLGEDVYYEYSILPEVAEHYVGEVDGALLVLLDVHLTPELVEEGWMREYLALIHRVRKDLHLTGKDTCTLHMTPLPKKSLEQTLLTRVQHTELFFDLESTETTPYGYEGVYVRGE